MRHLFAGRRLPAFVGAAVLVAAVAASAALFGGNARAAASHVGASLQVTEHFNGQTFTLTPTNWHGAKDCAIVTPSQAYCFSSDAAFNSFTSAPRAADGSAVSTASAMTPDTSGVCNGWAKIWNGPNWTNTGLAFQDYGYQQYLGDYTTVPFNVVSWFTDGQRGYAKMTDCYGIANDPGGVTLHTNAESTNDGGHEVTYIELYFGTG